MITTILQILSSPKLIILVGLIGGLLAFAQLTYFLLKSAFKKESVGFFGWLFKGLKIVIAILSAWLTLQIYAMINIQLNQVYQHFMLVYWP